MWKPISCSKVRFHCCVYGFTTPGSMPRTLVAPTEPRARKGWVSVSSGVPPSTRFVKISRRSKGPWLTIRPLMSAAVKSS